MIVYVAFEVDMHGLTLRSMDEIEALRATLDAAVRTHVHPELIDCDTDVEVVLLEHAGNPEDTP
jgi:hypothetical protein